MPREIFTHGKELTWYPPEIMNRAYSTPFIPGRLWQLAIDGWHPMRLNKAVRHWGTMNRAKKEAILLFSLAAQSAGCTAAPGQRVLHLRLEGFRVKPDADAYDKVVLDALVRSGLLLNDDEGGLLGRMGFEAVLGKERRTVLLIGDVHKDAHLL